MDMIGIKIKNARENKNMSIYELANKSGVSDSYLSRLEKGQRKAPSLSTVIKIVTALEISIEDLIK